MGTYGYYTGSMDIPEERKEEFFRQVVKLANYGGMMDYERVSLYGYDMALLKPVEICREGRVYFDYNYFEDDIWETAGYDSNKTCFYSGKIGNFEFCDVVTAIHFLYEVNDDDAGVTEVNDCVINADKFVGWINHLLGTAYSLKKRFRLWDCVEKYALSEEASERTLTAYKVMEFIPYSMWRAIGGLEFADLLYIIKGTESLAEQDFSQDSYPADVYRCKKAVTRFLEANTDDAMEQIQGLLRRNREEREQTDDAELAELAQFSLFLPARVIAYLTAEIRRLDFWKLWKEMHETVYHDEVLKQYAFEELEKEWKSRREAPIPPVRTSEFLRQDGHFVFLDTPEEAQDKPKYFISDDDRMYWWDGSDEVILSGELNQWLKALALEHRELAEKIAQGEMDQNEFLKDFLTLLVEINHYYKRIYPFHSMFYDFLQNGSKREYRAAVEQLRKLADDNREEGSIIKTGEYSWEVTSRQVTHNIGRIRLKRYLSVMANRTLRQRYFGF